MKRWIALVLTIALALTLCACGKKDSASPAVPAASAAPEPASDPGAEIAAAAALFDEGDYTAALDKLRELQDTGSPAVSAMLGRAYYQGLDGRQDFNRAAVYLQEAAAGGVASARYLLAEASRTGSGLPRDPDEATKAYIKFVAAADETDPADPDYGPAMVGLADCFANGRGVEKKFELALDAANKAAAAPGLTPFELMSLARFFDSARPNSVSAEADATGNYELENARKVDAAKAEELYTRAAPGIRSLAEAGNLAAAKLLGDLYLDGKGGLPQDYARAKDTYMIAADADYAEAQAQLGYMYLNGLGVETDYVEAMEWSNRAAAQGNAQGMEQIGSMYQNGLGVTQNLDEAGRWYTKARDFGSERAAALLEQTEATNPHGSFEAHA